MEWNNRRYRELYGKWDDEDNTERTEEEIELVEIINDISDTVWQYCKENGIRLCTDDRAEDFVGAITKFILESKEEYGEEWRR